MTRTIVIAAIAALAAAGLLALGLTHAALRVESEVEL